MVGVTFKASTEELHLDGLNDTKVQLVEQLVSAYGYTHAMSALAKVSGYREAPPTIDEFIHDRDYLGNMLGFDEDLGRDRLYPAWKKVLNDVFPNQFYSPYNEVIFSGSIGSGKTTCALAGLLYDLCKITHLAQPQKKFKLLDSTVILFAFMNATLKLSQDVIFSQFTEWIERSAYFRSLANKAKDGSTLFPNRVGVIAGSRFDQTLGRAIVAVLLDEANFHRSVKNQAYDTYNSVKARIDTRFIGKGGILPAHMWLVSSKSDDTGWLQGHIDKSRDIPSSLIVEYPIWEVLKCKNIYSGKKFKVFIGDKSRDPFLIDRAEQTLGIPDELIIDVPIEYYQNFANDIVRSLQDLAGTGTWSYRNFISSVELIEEAQVRPNPVSKDIITLDFFDQNQRIIDYICYEDIDIDSRPRFIHVDIGLRKDRTGIASVRYDGYVQLKRFDPRTGLTMTSREPIYYVDFVMAIEPRPGHEVPLYKIKQLMTDLRKRNYPIAKITVDGYQSANLRQDLGMLGFEVEEISVDRRKDPYNNLKNIILESRLNCVHHPVLNAELKNLVDTEKKIDHKRDGSKDVADALAGASWVALQNLDAFGNTMSSGEYMSAFERYVGEEESVYEKLFQFAEGFYPTGDLR
jgi:hypothetical protein